MASPATPNSKKATSRRIAVTRPGITTGFVERTARALFTSRTRRGPLLVPSEKADGLLGCESALEGLFACAARFDARVKRIHAQPCVMDVVTGLTAPDRDQLAQRLSLAGYSMHDATLWFVDFELELHDNIRPVYVEVKPARRAAEVADKLVDRKAACERIGVEFLLVLDTDIAEPLATNLRIMQRYAGVEVRDQVRAAALAALDGGSMSLYALATVTGLGLAHLYQLVASGELDCDLRKELLGRKRLANPSFQ